MHNQLLLFLIISFVVAGAGAWFHYFYKKTIKKANILLAFLRFLAIFTLLMLFFNPQIETTSIRIEKPVLAVLVDNSSSVQKQQQQIESFIDDLRTNKGIQGKFETSYFKFGASLQELDSLSFTEKVTSIYTPLASLQEVYKNRPAALLLISDGNQTVGSSLDFLPVEKPIYTVITGDTVHYNDVSIHKLNVNKYSYLKNNFPVEAFIYYSGEEGLRTTVSVVHNNKKVYSEPLVMEPGEHSKQVQFKLSSNKVGKQFYTFQIAGLTSEKNTRNNQRRFAVDVIDEQSKIAIITGVMHPDLGMLKRSIETNKQRKVSIIPIQELTANLNSFDLLILYQPNATFKNVFEKIQRAKINYFIITGKATDWAFLNKHQTVFKKNISRVKEAYLPVFNTGYSVFLTEDIGFSELPPVEDTFGKVTVSTSFETVLYQQINTIRTKDPLLFTYRPSEGQKAAVLLGDGVWKWRSFNYQKEQSFLKFDAFLANLIQYLATNADMSRLSVQANSFYNENERIDIAAILTDHNYKFDPNAKLWLAIKARDGRYKKKVPFALASNAYSVVLNDVPVGMYHFTISIEGQFLKKYGKFSVKEFNAEQVFDASNVDVMKDLAIKSKGEFYSLEVASEIMTALLSNNALKPIQKTVTTNTPLIQLKWLLGLLIVLLGTEWFTRKYLGEV